MDENGYFKITGRLKDMIIRGGENIYPREIEEFLYTHPSVKDVQVVGVPDAKYGEEVLACVILKEDACETEQSLIDFIRDGLSKFKAPRYVRFYRVVFRHDRERKDSKVQASGMGDCRAWPAGCGEY